MNKYTEDGNFIIDATGKQWPVETAHPLPLPEGITNPYDESGFSLVVFWPSPDEPWAGCQFRISTHWLARRPLPPVPKPKTQAEKDEEAFQRFHESGKGYSIACRNGDVKLSDHDCQKYWRAALAYARNEK